MNNTRHEAAHNPELVRNQAALVIYFLKLTPLVLGVVIIIALALGSQTSYVDTLRNPQDVNETEVLRTCLDLEVGKVLPHWQFGLTHPRHVHR